MQESASTQESDKVYDPKNDTVYVSTHSAPAPDRKPWQIRRGPRPGTFVLSPSGAQPKAVSGGVAPPKLVITARQVRALRKRTVAVALKISKRDGGLSLAVQHPKATVDRDPADYRAAEVRLFPHG